MLSKLGKQDGDIQEMAQVRAQLELVQEELAVSQKGCDYYQNNMIPEIKKQFEEARAHAQQLRNENASLMLENRNLKGSTNDQIQHFETENRTCKGQTAEAEYQTTRALNENKQLRDNVKEVSDQLKVKTQELALKQEALAKAQSQIEVMRTEQIDKNNQQNGLSERVQLLETSVSELNSQKEDLEKELRCAVQISMTQGEQLNQDASRIQVLEKARNDSLKTLEELETECKEHTKSFTELSGNYKASIQSSSEAR